MGRCEGLGTAKRVRGPKGTPGDTRRRWIITSTTTNTDAKGTDLYLKNLKAGDCFSWFSPRRGHSYPTRGAVAHRRMVSAAGWSLPGGAGSSPAQYPRGQSFEYRTALERLTNSNQRIGSRRIRKRAPSNTFALRAVTAMRFASPVVAHGSAKACTARMRPAKEIGNQLVAEKDPGGRAARQAGGERLDKTSQRTRIGIGQPTDGIGGDVE